MQADFLAAVKQGDAERVRTLLEQDPLLLASRDENGVSAVMWSVYRMQPVITDLLLSHKPELQFFEAAAVGDLPAVRRHVEHDPEAARRYAPDGFSALGLAAFFGRVAVADCLLAAGADPNAASRNKMQVTPLHSAVANRDPDTALALTRLLLKHGAKVNVAQEGGWTPLHQAAAHGQVAVLELLLARGANPSSLSADGRTPVELARGAGHTAAVSLLEQAAG